MDLQDLEARSRDQDAGRAAEEHKICQSPSVWSSALIILDNGKWYSNSIAAQHALIGINEPEYPHIYMSMYNIPVWVLL